MAARYQLSNGLSNLNGVSAAYGVSSTHTGDPAAYIGMAFFPTSGLSAMQITGAGIVGSPTYFSALSTNTALPALMINDGSGSATRIYGSFVFDNTWLHANNENKTFSTYICTYADASYLSGGTGETLNVLQSGVVDYEVYGPYTLVALGDAGAPTLSISGLSATGSDRSVLLEWVNQSYADLSAIKIRRSTSPITAVTDGTLVYTGLLSTYTDTSFDPSETGVNLYYAGYSMDNVGKNSTITTGATAVAVASWMNWSSLAEHSRLYVEGII